MDYMNYRARDNFKRANDVPFEVREILIVCFLDSIFYQNTCEKASEGACIAFLGLIGAIGHPR